MIDRPSTDKLDPLSDAWQTAMDQGRYRDALKAGCQAYLLNEKEGDEKGSMAALGLVHLAIAELIFGNKTEGPTSSPCCSFCGRRGSEVRLGAGPDVFICADCVAIFHEALASKADEPPPREAPSGRR